MSTQEDADDYLRKVKDGGEAFYTVEMRESRFWRTMIPRWGYDAETFLNCFNGEHPKKLEEIDSLRTNEECEEFLRSRNADSLSDYLDQGPIASRRSTFKYDQAERLVQCCKRAVTQSRQILLRHDTLHDINGHPIGFEEIGKNFAYAVHRGDWQFIDKIKTILERESTRDPQVKSSSELNYAQKRDRWIGFCRFVMNKYRLPTKGELGALWNAPDKKKQGKWLKELGLGGLPQDS